MRHRTIASDEGVTLIETIVALLVFAILATGIVAAMGTIIRMTGDNQARATAANLASQDLDLARAIADPFSVAASTTSTLVDGRTYTVQRTVSWVSKAGGDISCNSSTNLFYLRVNTRVTWPGMLGSTAAVQDDTLLAPSARINDGSSGSIAVTVVGADGGPEAGVAVTVTPKSGGTGKALTTQPKATTADGCTYANQVAPGVYTVSITRTASIGDFDVQLAAPQSTTSTKEVTVTAGTTQSLPFQYDEAATYSVNYTTGPIVYSAGVANRPTAFETNFTNTYGTVTTTTGTSPVKLHPYPVGYAAFTGKRGSGSTSCASVDPAAWTGSGTLGDGVRAAASAPAGGAATLNIPMGVVLVRAPLGYYIGATQGTPQAGSGNPGCAATGSIYSPSVKGTGGWVPLALPYGAWKIYYGTSATSGTQLGSANLQVVTNTLGGGVAADGTVTLDPRPAK